MELNKGFKLIPVIGPKNQEKIKAIEFKGHFLFINFLNGSAAKYKIEFVECYKI